MKPDILERNKEYLSSFKAVETEELFEYFRNSNDFTLHSKNRGLDTTSNNDNVVYVDAELDERNTYIEYIANDGSFIVRIDKYGIREVQLKQEGELFLEKTGNTENESPVYRVSCK